MCFCEQIQGACKPAVCITGGCTTNLLMMDAAGAICIADLRLFEVSTLKDRRSTMHALIIILSKQESSSYTGVLILSSSFRGTALAIQLSPGI
jgi:hypothetical protein